MDHHPQWLHPMVRQGILFATDGLVLRHSWDERFWLDRRHAEYVVSFLRSTPRIHRLRLACNIQREDGTMDVLSDFLSQQQEATAVSCVELLGLPQDDGSLLECLSKAAKDNSLPYVVELSISFVDLSRAENKLALETLLLAKTRDLRKLQLAFCRFDSDDVLFLQNGLGAQTGAEGSLCQLHLMGETGSMLPQNIFRDECFLANPDCKLESLTIHVSGNPHPLVEQWKTQLLSLILHQPSMSLRVLHVRAPMLVATAIDIGTEMNWQDQINNCLYRNKRVAQVQQSFRPEQQQQEASSLVLGSQGLAKLARATPAAGLTPMYLLLSYLIPQLAERVNVSRRRARCCCDGIGQRQPGNTETIPQSAPPDDG